MHRQFDVALVFLGILLVSALAACEAAEPISYSTGDIAVEVSKETRPFDNSIAYFEGLHAECGVVNDRMNSAQKLHDTFKDTSMTVYNLKYPGPKLEGDTYVVTLLPNKMGYTTLVQFEEDFDYCAAGGNMYPKILNKDWLLFVSSCGSGGPVASEGCVKVEEAVEPTLKLN